jgi:hypothetical protein
VPAGALGLGEVVEAKRAKGSGAPGVLILGLRYLQVGNQQIPLRGLVQDTTGKDRMSEARLFGSYVFTTLIPDTLLGMAVNGNDTMVPKGGKADARIAATVTLGEGAAPVAAPALMPTHATALRDGTIVEAPANLDPLPVNASLSVPAPPEGLGQVVFYRPGSLFWKAIGCTVQENGKKLSSLGSGRWVAVLARPGLHTYRVTGETSDSLRLDIEPGKTQFVSCKMRSSVLIARPYIRPDTMQEFHKQLDDLRPVDDDDMGADNPGGQALRRADLRLALAQRGDVRGRQAGANRDVAQEGVLETTDAGTKAAIAQGLRKLGKEATK